MANILLDYAVPFSQITNLPPPSFGFLHKLAVVVLHDVPATPADVTVITDPSQLAALTAHAAELQGAFDGGLSSIILIRVSDIAELPALIEGREGEWYTLFGHHAIDIDGFITNTATWGGVRSTVSDDLADAPHASLANVCLFGHVGSSLSAYNPLFAFGRLLSAGTWRNQQYITTTNLLGLAGTLGICESLFEARVSFWLQDDDNGNRLGFFAAGGLSITTPYISKEVELTIQYQQASFLAVNQPFNVAVSRNELARLGLKVINQFIEMGYLDPDKENSLTVIDTPEAFTVAGNLVTSPSVALWRVRMDAFQTQG